MLGPILLLAFVFPAGAQQSDEYRVKAAFLYHFAQMVDWPAEAMSDQKKAVTICTFGKDPFGGDLESTLQGKTIGTRQLQVRHAKQPGELQACDVVFVPGDRKQIAPALAAIRDEAVLTVGEGDDFTRQGGMIGFCMESNKVRFDINMDAASRARLKISSRLLALAKSVIGSHP